VKGGSTAVTPAADAATAMAVSTAENLPALNSPPTDPKAQKRGFFGKALHKVVSVMRGISCLMSSNCTPAETPADTLPAACCAAKVDR